MAYSLGEIVKMKGDYWMQPPRKAIAEDLEQHMVKALNSFKVESGTKSYPERVVVYRGGVSEGEYLKVCYCCFLRFDFIPIDKIIFAFLKVLLTEKFS